MIRILKSKKIVFLLSAILLGSSLLCILFIIEFIFDPFYPNFFPKGNLAFIAISVGFLCLLLIQVIENTSIFLNFKIVFYILLATSSMLALILMSNAKDQEISASVFIKNGWEIKNWPYISAKEVENYFPNSFQKNIFHLLPSLSILNQYFYTDVVYISNLDTEPSLTKMELDFNKINTLKKLRFFGIDFSKLNNLNDHTYIFNNLLKMRDLRCLYIKNYNGKCLNSFLKFAKNLPCLKVLSITGSPNLSSDVVEDLFTWRNLQHLEISGGEFKSFPNPTREFASKLKTLTFDSAERIDETIWNLITSCPALEEINVSRSKMTNKNIENLILNKKIRKLWIPFTVINKESINLFEFIENLKILNLKGCDITDSDIKFLNKINHLETLDLSYNLITDKIFLLIINLKTLKKLSIDGTQVSREEVVRFESLRPHIQFYKRIINFQNYGDLQDQLDLP